VRPPRRSPLQPSTPLSAAPRDVDRGANHHCFAYIIGDDEQCRIERYSDDGEPGGTAGAPMLQALKARDLVNVAAVVSRYFGGVKLGTGGLARAYSGTVISAIEKANLRPRLRWQVYRLTADHAEAGRLEAALRGRGFEVSDVTYGERAIITVLCVEEDHLRSAINELTSGRADFAHTGQVWR
jgi:uncharacterized YigZ family protein